MCEYKKFLNSCLLKCTRCIQEQVCVEDEEADDDDFVLSEAHHLLKMNPKKRVSFSERFRNMDLFKQAKPAHNYKIEVTAIITTFVVRE